MTKSVHTEVEKNIRIFFQHEDMISTSNICNDSFSDKRMKKGNQNLKINLFFLPEFTRSEENSSEIFKIACNDLRFQLYSMPKPTPLKISEKEWARLVSKIWSDIENS